MTNLIGGVVLRAANPNCNDCRWQSYNNVHNPALRMMERYRAVPNGVKITDQLGKALSAATRSKRGSGEPLPLFHNILCPVTIRAVPNGVKTTDQLGHALSAATCRKKRKRRTASSLLLCFVPGNESSGTQWCKDNKPDWIRIVRGHCPPYISKGSMLRTG